MNPNQKESLPIQQIGEIGGDNIPEIAPNQEDISIEKGKSFPKIPSSIINDNNDDGNQQQDDSTDSNTVNSTIPNSIQVSSDMIADDVDVIEKEWVDRAKKVISDNKNDPRQQGHEINLVKKDYLDKRYGKKLKIESED